MAYRWQATFLEHDKEERHRIKNSQHRFFEHPAPQKEARWPYDWVYCVHSDQLELWALPILALLSLKVRSANIFHEGLRGTVKESAIIGYGRHGEFLTISFSFLDKLQRKSRWHCLYSRFTCQEWCFSHKGTIAAASSCRRSGFEYFCEFFWCLFKVKESLCRCWKMLAFGELIGS